MNTLRRLILWPIITGFVLLSTGCIVEPRHDDAWCANHPYKCDR